MKLLLPANVLYGNIPEEIEIPDGWDVQISKINGFDAPPLSVDALRERICDPIGAPSIKEGAAGCKNAVVIIDDITRPTPCEAIARIVIDELIEAGVPEENIWFIVALGAHGCMYREDFIRKLGKEIVEKFEVYNHNAFLNHTYVGKTSSGIPVEINQDVMQAEYKVAIGTMMPHSFYGFSGGAKSILPGVASINTICKNHSFTSPNEFNMGNPETIIRKDAEEAASLMGLDYKIDVLLNGRAEICALFAGNFRDEAAVARKVAARHYRANFVSDCDLVIANNYFKPLEASCAYTPEVIASLREGGDFVLAANSPYGCCVHYLYDKWGKTSPGGALWAGLYGPTESMHSVYLFSKYTVKGMRDSWFVDEKKGAHYCKDWNTIIREIDDGRRKKVVLYPMAESQILSNSSQYYTYNCK